MMNWMTKRRCGGLLWVGDLIPRAVCTTVRTWALLNCNIDAGGYTGPDVGPVVIDGVVIGESGYHSDSDDEGNR